jgi:hypothetical protein
MWGQVCFDRPLPTLSRRLQLPPAMRRTFLVLALMVAGLCALVQHLQLGN